MNQLLAVALKLGQGTASDKFAFISDSSLPAKPFSFVYNTLITRTGSDFCIFPSSEWADIASTSSGLETAVKHHQWVTLERSHAERVAALWSAGLLHDLMTPFRMNAVAYTSSNNSFGDSRNFGCLDEFWHMAALYGTLHRVTAYSDQAVQLSLFTGAPLRVSATSGWQGECDTFVVWSRYLHSGGGNPFERLYTALDSASVPHGGNFQRPGWWDRISLAGIGAIRGSSFLFARKFIDKPRLADGGNFAEAWTRIIMDS